MASISTLQPVTYYNSKRQIFASGLEYRAVVQFSKFNYTTWNYRKSYLLRVCCSSENADENKSVRNEVEKDRDVVLDSEKPGGRLRETITSLTPVLVMMKKKIGTNYAVGLFIAFAIVVISIREYLKRKSRSNYHGSVAELVKRGQLRSDRRGISRPLKYDDPFNNPLVKVSKSNSSVEMCGKVYRLAPVTLTEVEQSNHQKRRSRAYQWKRPTMFLKEGDSIPPDVDPDTVRWIPANHPFATTVNEIDEDLAQSNVYQKHGVPFRIKAEHEALQRKLETLQSEQKLNKLVIDAGNVRNFERPFKSSTKSNENAEQRPSHHQGGDSGSPKPDTGSNSSDTKKPSDEP